MEHVSVFIKEVISFSKVLTSQRIIDATLGGGGHTKALLKEFPQVKVLAIDLDQTALDKAKEDLSIGNLFQRCILKQGNFSQIKEMALSDNFSPVATIIADLGFSSLQLDDPKRGFSFQSLGPLDMRLNPNQPTTAESIINRADIGNLTRIFSELGEEKFSYAIARAIVKNRQTVAIRDTLSLAAIIHDSLPKPIKHKATDHQRRIFQALRIEVNGELENLKRFLPLALELLEIGGRLIVITFHSLEDRIVKKFFVEESKGCVCPPDFPECVCSKASNVKIVTRKPVIPGLEETERNPRSKSAKLRVAEKI